MSTSPTSAGRNVVPPRGQEVAAGIAVSKELQPPTPVDQAHKNDRMALLMWRRSAGPVTEAAAQRLVETVLGRDHKGKGTKGSGTVALQKLSDAVALQTTADSSKDAMQSSDAAQQKRGSAKGPRTFDEKVYHW